MSENTELLERIFVGLVDQSWQRYNEDIKNKHMDDLLVGAVIASTVGSGFSLIDLNSDGVRHYLRFENMENRERIVFELTNMAEDTVTAKVRGRWARTVIGYGSPSKDTKTAWNILKAEVKSSFIVDRNEPGVITFDADLTSGYIYAQVPLLLNLDRYFGEGYEIKYDLLQRHTEAAIHSLKKYLQGRLK